MSFNPDLVNDNDISLVATDGNKVVGFLWVGLMANNTMAYIDRFIVHQDYRGRGIGNKLGTAAFKQAAKKNVEEFHGFIKNDSFYEASAVNALRLGLGGDNKPYTHVRGHLSFIASELAILERAA